MGKRVMEMADTDRKEYREIYGIWLDYSKTIGENITDLLGGKDGAFGRMQKTWSECREDIGARISKAVKADHDGFEEFQKTWTKYSGKMSEYFTEQVKGQMRNGEDIYQTWMDSFGHAGMDGEGLNDVAHIMGKYWTETMRKVGKDTQKILAKDGDVSQKSRELYDSWSNSYAEMFKDIMKTPSFASWLGSVRDAGLDVTVQTRKANEEFLRSMGAPTRSDMDEVYKVLKDLTMDIKDLKTHMKGQEREKERKK